MKLLIGWLGKAVSAVVFFGPYFMVRFYAAVLAFLWFDLFRIRRDVVDSNIKIAFPEMTKRERARLGRKNLRHLGINFLEFCYMPFLNKSNYARHFEFHGQENIDRVLAKKKGVILLTLHLGNGDMASAGLALHGYPIVVLSKYFKLKWLNDLWFGLREKFGTEFIPARDSSFPILKALKRGKSIAIPLDQFTGPPIGVRTTFFGVETGTAAGMAVMAERSGAPVLLIHTVRLPDGRCSVTWGKEIPVPLFEGETSEQITQRFNDELEALVRMKPEQWMWIHRRWKKYKF